MPRAGEHARSLWAADWLGQRRLGRGRDERFSRRASARRWPTAAASPRRSSRRPELTPPVAAIDGTFDDDFAPESRRCWSRSAPVRANDGRGGTPSFGCSVAVRRSAAGWRWPGRRRMLQQRDRLPRPDSRCWQSGCRSVVLGSPSPRAITQSLRGRGRAGRRVPFVVVEEAARPVHRALDDDWHVRRGEGGRERRVLEAGNAVDEDAEPAVRTTV